MPRITVVNREDEAVEVDLVTGISLMENIRGLDHSVDAICGGMCACATCHVYLDEIGQARLGLRSYEETFMLRNQSTFDESRSRLSCQIIVDDAMDGLTVKVAPAE